MTKTEAIEILTEHNLWRRGAGRYDAEDVPTPLPKFSPKQIGEAMDFAIKFMEKGI